MGSKYTKAVFRPYTDATFTRRAPHDAHLGILGPTIRAEPGDKIVVHFLNRLPFNASVQVRGSWVGGNMGAPSVQQRVCSCHAGGAASACL